MFTIYNKPSHQFKNKTFYKIDDLMNAYEEFRHQSSHIQQPLPYEEAFANGQITFRRVNKYLNWLLKIYKENHEFRCSICGCKANHFRLMKDETFHLFGIKHDSKTNTGIYLFFNRDHIVPASMNGSCINSNLRLTCERCNTIRGNEVSQIQNEAFTTNNIARLKNAIITVLGLGRRKLRTSAETTLPSPERHLINNLIKFISEEKNDSMFLGLLYDKLENMK